jgi:hypothetical protein
MVLELFLVLCIPILIAFAIKSDNTCIIIGGYVWLLFFLQLLLFSTLYTTEFSMLRQNAHLKFLITSVFIS